MKTFLFSTMVSSVLFTSAIFTGVVFTSCGSGNTAPAAGAPSAATSASDTTATSGSGATGAPASTTTGETGNMACDTTTVRSFFKWYAKDRKKIAAIYIVDLPAPGDTSGYYKVNYDHVEKYLSALRGTGLFSASFLSGKYKYFQDCDKKMAASKQNDGAPEGLDADLLLYNMDPEGILKEAAYLKLKADNNDAKGNHVVKAETADNYLLFTIVRDSGNCQIDNIQFKEKDRL